MSSSTFQDLLAAIAERGRKILQRQPGPPAGEGLAGLAEAILSGRGEASGTAAARQFLDCWKGLGGSERMAFFHHLASDFGPDHEAIAAAIRAYADAPDDLHAMTLHMAAEPRRQELFRRLNRAPGGTARLVAMRTELLGLLKEAPELAPVDRDFEHLLASWFNRGFLVLDRIDWNTPASILERIIQYEAVHEIHSWDDLRRRIEPRDRRCYAFFHPALVDDPLIFVEVALTRGIPTAIAPILAAERTPLAADAADTAVFYSISNCQEGLRGISFGNFLIKQVVEELKRDLPDLRTFVTLSPAPGLRRWLAGLADEDAPGPALGSEEREALARLDEDDWHRDAPVAASLKGLISPLVAWYFLNAKRGDGLPVDAVARFHLGNGARLEQIDWLGDASPRGLAEAAGVMVNYLYDLRHIEDNHELFVNQRQVVASSQVRRLVKHQPRAITPPPARDLQAST
jgi:malonyl-CoA decarboxylase